MALAVLTAAALRLTLPAALRFHDVSWLLGVFVVGILAVLMIGDPGRIDRQATWLRVLTDILIGVITVVIAEGSPDAVRNDPLVIAAYLGTDERMINRSDTGRAAETIAGV